MLEYRAEEPDCYGNAEAPEEELEEEVAAAGGGGEGSVCGTFASIAVFAGGVSDDCADYGDYYEYD